MDLRSIDPCVLGFVQAAGQRLGGTGGTDRCIAKCQALLHHARDESGERRNDPLSRRLSQRNNLDAGQDYKAVLDDFKAFFGTIKVKIELTDKEKGGGRIVIAFTDTDELNEYFKRVEQ